jgi:hypothetical protein
MASGSSNGTTKIAMVVQTLLERHKDFVLLKLDAANAFNSINRKKVIQRTVRAFPLTYTRSVQTSVLYPRSTDSRHHEI